MGRFNFSVKVFELKNSNSSLKAFASITIEEVIEIKGFKVFDGRNGLFVSPPSTKATKPDEEGKFPYWPDVIFHEDTAEENRKGPVQEEIEKAILSEYSKRAATSRRGDAAYARANSPSPTGERPNPMFDDKTPW